VLSLKVVVGFGDLRLSDASDNTIGRSKENVLKPQNQEQGLLFRPK
jgi:hypothetical protein